MVLTLHAVSTAPRTGSNCINSFRPLVAELHEDLREVTKRARPDWKIDTPEMRAMWQNGERVDFYPHGKSWRQVFIRMAGEVDQFEQRKGMSLSLAQVQAVLTYAALR